MVTNESSNDLTVTKESIIEIDEEGNEKITESVSKESSNITEDEKDITLSSPGTATKTVNATEDSVLKESTDIIAKQEYDTEVEEMQQDSMSKKSTSTTKEKNDVIISSPATTTKTVDIKEDSVSKVSTDIIAKQGSDTKVKEADKMKTTEAPIPTIEESIKQVSTSVLVKDNKTATNLVSNDSTAVTKESSATSITSTIEAKKENVTAESFPKESKATEGSIVTHAIIGIKEDTIKEPSDLKSTESNDCKVVGKAKGLHNDALNSNIPGVPTDSDKGSKNEDGKSFEIELIIPGTNKKHSVKVNEGQSSDEVAKQFCLEHNIKDTEESILRPIRDKLNISSAKRASDFEANRKVLEKSLVPSSPESISNSRVIVSGENEKKNEPKKGDIHIASKEDKNERSKQDDRPTSFNNIKGDELEDIDLEIIDDFDNDAILLQKIEDLKEDEGAASSPMNKTIASFFGIFCCADKRGEGDLEEE